MNGYILNKCLMGFRKCQKGEKNTCFNEDTLGHFELAEIENVKSFIVLMIADDEWLFSSIVFFHLPEPSCLHSEIKNSFFFLRTCVQLDTPSIYPRILCNERRSSKHDRCFTLIAVSAISNGCRYGLFTWRNRLTYEWM